MDYFALIIGAVFGFVIGRYYHLFKKAQRMMQEENKNKPEQFFLT